ncbi:MAG: hypothetical protein QXE91_03785 [Thermofilaceae archaeon]
MRRIAWTLIMLLTLVPLSATAAPSVEAKARVEPPYVILTLSVQDLPTSTFTLDIGNFSHFLEYAFAVTNGAVAYGSLEGSKLIFQTKMVGNTTIYMVLRTFKYEYHSIVFSLPAPLAPIETLPCNFSLTIYGLPSMPSVIQSPFNVTTGYNESLRYYIKGATVAEEPWGNLTFSIGTTRLPPTIKRVERTLMIDAQRVIIVDNITLQGITDYNTESIDLTYPLSLDVEEVGGLVGPYPRALYTVTRTGNSTQVGISLLAPPAREGDLAFVWVKLSSPLLSKDNRYLIPAYAGIGHYVPSFTVTLKVRGSLTGLSEAAVEGDYRVYKLPERKLLGVEVDPYIMLEGSLLPPPQPNYLLISMIFAVIAALSYFMSSRVGRAAPTETRVEVKLTGELIAVLKERSDNLAAFLDSWSKYDKGKLSRQAYRQAVLRYRRRETELRRRAREVALKSEESLKLLDKVDNIFFEVEKLLNRLDELKTSMEKGLMPQTEGRRRITELNERLEQLRNELEELIVKYSES